MTNETKRYIFQHKSSGGDWEDCLVQPSIVLSEDESRNKLIEHIKEFTTFDHRLVLRTIVTLNSDEVIQDFPLAKFILKYMAVVTGAWMEAGRHSTYEDAYAKMIEKARQNPRVIYRIDEKV